MLQPAGRGCCAVLWLGLVLAAAGCVPIGPSAVPSDQVDYADAISEASKRMTLTNIVKTRYGDAPSYLVASQIVAGYQLQANATVNVDLDNSGGWSLRDVRRADGRRPVQQQSDHHIHPGRRRRFRHAPAPTDRSGRHLCADRRRDAA